MKTVTLALIAATAFGGAVATSDAAFAQPGRWMTINQRQAMLDRRIDRGIETGDLTRREATQARREFRQIARLEARYRQNGLSNWERQDLDRRFDQLAMQIRWDRRDAQRSYGYYDGPRR